MNRITVLLITILLSIVMIGCASNDVTEDDDKSNEGSNNNNKTLTFGKTPWTSTVPPTEIAKIILEDIGYEVEEEEADAGVVFAGLGSGDVDIFMDYWEPQHTPLLEEFSDSIEILSTSYENAEWGLAVPEYMEDVHDVGDLKGKEDIVNNEVLAIEAGDPAVEDVPKVIDKYDLDMEMVNSSEAAMIAATKAKLDNKEPVVLFGWRPHSMFNHLDIKLLTNEQATEYFIASDVSVVANEKLKEDAPDAYDFLSNWSIPIVDMEEMIAEIENGEDPEEVAQTWIDNNKDKVDEMLENE
ncbi:glycine betaine ABC transporter substrate-binding protein [Virgibacillus alimentarius]|uniref:Glycine betaine/proline transport system substrate-binding protein n=1 Tax=Virgibacillus alimentarius TaxID=698769 RepID=A0ABS4SD89_9BACI|nr:MULTISPECIES: glycine betaine ABC transporter substrate-binding protein [Virgibacillus]MBP2259066.1 glycine betaine/proline transport system substrate-binding protein [Virgibacillus alimentarius]HLR66827.1 glycine betaine ABC transporter substrate-binding protein [Virgibacillus sp.]